MRRTIIASLLFLCVHMMIGAQITSLEAYSKVRGYMATLSISDSVGLYMLSPLPINTTSIILANKDTLISPSFDSYAFFIDEYPYQNWGHPCRFLFVNIENGAISTDVCLFPPKDITSWEPISVPSISIQNLSPHLSIPPKRQSHVFNNKAEHCYALIISGGVDSTLNYVRYWNDCSAMYTILKDVYGYLDENIYVIMSDGRNPATDRCCYDNIYDSSPWDLDDDGIDDVEYPATRESIATVCDELSSKLTQDDFLFVFTTDHGDTTLTGVATMCLWGDEIDAPTFASEIDKIKAGSINIVMEQCFSGGFVSALTKKNRTIATACSSMEESWAMPYEGYVYNEFVYHWMSAVYGYTPDLVHSVSGVDCNHDGLISMKEAFDYAEKSDVQFETPQYASIKPHYGEYVTLFGVNETQKTVVNNQNIIVDGVIHGYNVEITNSTLNSGADITIEASKTIVIGANTKILKGSTLKTE